MRVAPEVHVTVTYITIDHALSKRDRTEALLKRKCCFLARTAHILRSPWYHVESTLIQSTFEIWNLEQWKSIISSRIS